MFSSELAMALHGLATLQGALGRKQAALPAAQKA
jgi:hypothetical protein